MIINRNEIINRTIKLFEEKSKSDDKGKEDKESKPPPKEKKDDIMKKKIIIKKEFKKLPDWEKLLKKIEKSIIDFEFSVIVKVINKEKILVEPEIEVDGNYWTIYFYYHNKKWVIDK